MLQVRSNCLPLVYWYQRNPLFFLPTWRPRRQWQPRHGPTLVGVRTYSPQEHDPFWNLQLHWFSSRGQSGDQEMKERYVEQTPSYAVHSLFKTAGVSLYSMVLYIADSTEEDDLGHRNCWLEQLRSIDTTKLIVRLKRFSLTINLVVSILRSCSNQQFLCPRSSSSVESAMYRTMLYKLTPAVLNKLCTA